MTEEIYSRVAARIGQYRNLVIELQKALTAIPALGPDNGGQGELEKAGYLKSFLDDLGMDELLEINSPDKRVDSGYRPNLIAKIHGKETDRTLWIMSHMDIVPPGDLSLWTTDPYSVLEKDGKLFGRGTEDDQQGIVASILVAKALRDEGIVPPVNLGLALVADEETGSKFGIEYVLKEKQELFSKEDLIIIPDAGDSDGTMIEVAEKSILWIKCETTGQQTHGSTPEKGLNAAKAASRFIVQMDDLYKKFPVSDPLFDPPISTFEPTKRESNVENINTIPGRDVVYFDCRVLPEIPLGDVENQINEWARAMEEKSGVKIDISIPQKVNAPPPTSADASVVHALKRAVKAVLNRDAQAIGIGGGTVAAFFREAGLPAVCWCTLDDTLHAPNEYCVIDNVLNDAKVFTHVLFQE
jgi:succinyl-diaminopimelate desuccinylase